MTRAEICLLFFLFAAPAFSGAAEQSPLGESNTRVLESYKRAYPAFDFAAAAREAAELRSPLKQGDFVVVRRHYSSLSGKFYSVSGGKICVDGQYMPLSEVGEDQKYLFDPAAAEAARKKHTAEKYQSYLRQREADINGVLSALLEREALEAKTKNAGAILKSAAPGKKEAPRVSDLAVLTKDSGQAKAGELLRVLKRGSDGSARCAARSGKNISAEAGELFFLDKNCDPSDAFFLSQTAFKYMLANDFPAAKIYLALAAKADPSNRRVAAAAEAAAAVEPLEELLATANRNVAAHDKEISQSIAKLARNQAGLRDEFAVKAGVRDQSPVHAEKIFTEREKRKEWQRAIKQAHARLLDSGAESAAKLAADGDFIAACLLCDFMVSAAGRLKNSASAKWDEEEDAEIKSKISGARAVIERLYRERMSRPFSDKWEKLVDRLADMGGFDGAALNQFDVKPKFPQMLEAAKNTLRRSESFAAAAASGNIREALTDGVYILTLMITDDETGGPHKKLDALLASLDSALKSARRLASEKMFEQVILLAGAFNPQPPELARLAADAEKKIKESNAALESAAAAGEDRFDLALERAQKALEIWPFNKKAIELAASLSEKHKDFLEKSANIEMLALTGRFQDALESVSLALAEDPSLRAPLLALREKVKAARDARNKKRETAAALFQAGNFAAALSLLQDLNDAEGSLMVSKAMAEAAFGPKKSAPDKEKP
jgi:hypothetical protein